MTDQKLEILRHARELLGHPEPSAEIGIALNCAWDMGYRRPEALADMVSRILLAPGPAVSNGER